MLFLMNDAVLNLERQERPPLDPARFQALSLGYVMRLGQELFSERPMLHRTDPGRAERLAMLILAKAPEVNAALFVAPAQGCAVEEVQHRLANVSMELMGELYRKHRDGDLTPVAADREVWRRMAA